MFIPTLPKVRSTGGFFRQSGHRRIIEIGREENFQTNNEHFTRKQGSARHRGGAGLGLATAKAFAEAGASVVLADTDESAVGSAADALNAQNYKALAIHCDVSDDAQVEAMVAQTVATFGQLDAAYNNAGIQNILAETADATREDFDRVIAVSLRGVWSCMKFDLQQMRKQGSGAIVNCSSIGGLVGGAGVQTIMLQSMEFLG